MSDAKHYPWFSAGDLNAFFGLMLDNLSVLVMLTGILVGMFGFPVEIIFTRMLPGTALGVLAGDLAYSIMAFRLARRTGRTDITAMPLGLDTPSTIGIAFAVLGPVYLATKEPLVTWQVGMATMMLIGVCKLALSFVGDWVRRMVPQAGLLGSLAGIAVALLGLLPMIKIFHLPLVGLISLGIVLCTLVARLKLPGRLPGAVVAVAIGTAVYYVLGSLGVLDGGFHVPELTWRFTPPTPTLGFIEGLPMALTYLPIAIPFGLLTVVGGINVTESARVAGDDYKTRDILLVEALSTLLAGLTGGVAQSTPYIGHPAYKAMGARAGYTMATGLFVGLGGILGYVSFIVDALPEAAVVPILVFVALEIVAQAFEACPKAHFPAVGLAFLPALADLVQIQTTRLLGALKVTIINLPADVAMIQQIIVILGNGFILTAMLWGGFLANLIDRRLGRAALFACICGVLSLFGIIHSIDSNGGMYVPWEVENPWPIQLALGYTAVAGCLLLLYSTGATTVDSDKAEG
jgi:AGZA family xanthine/uracil permease-like MFS transporter